MVEFVQMRGHLLSIFQIRNTIQGLLFLQFLQFQNEVMFGKDCHIKSSVVILIDQQLYIFANGDKCVYFFFY